jgi:hypothetical protein
MAARAKLLPDPARMRASSHPALSGLASPRETHARTPAGDGASIAARSPFFIFAGIILQVRRGLDTIGSITALISAKRLIWLMNAGRQDWGFSGE